MFVNVHLHVRIFKSIYQWSIILCYKTGNSAIIQTVNNFVRFYEVNETQLTRVSDTSSLVD